jgi:magnesium transporter
MVGMVKPNPLVPLVRKYVETDAPAVARILEKMPEEDLLQALHELPPAVTAKAFPHLQAGYAATLLSTGSTELFREVTKELEPDRAARIFARLSSEARAHFVPHLSEKLRARVQEFLTYPEGSVGQVMSARYVEFRRHLTVREVITKLRKQDRSQSQYSYGYVVDDETRLIGVVSTYDLLLAPPSAQVDTLIRPGVFVLDPFMDAEAAADALAKRRYFAAPVVDAQGFLVGVVKAEELLAGVKRDVASDFQKMVGVGAEERTFSPIRFSLRTRLPWLQVNLVTAFAAAAVVAMFEGVIAKVTALAIFLPVVAGQGGNAGAQSLAIVMRGLVMREIPRDRVWRVIRKEGLLGVINGVVTGLVTAGVAWIWMGNAWLGLVIGLGMIVNLTCAGLAGASIPIAMKQLGLDPAQCSSIILTTVTDIVGFFAFLGFAVLFQGHLV